MSNSYQISKAAFRDMLKKIAADPNRQFYLCGCCCQYHPVTWNGDCRDDQARFDPDELDARYGPQGWVETDQP